MANISARLQSLYENLLCLRGLIYASDLLRDDSPGSEAETREALTGLSTASRAFAEDCVTETSKLHLEASTQADKREGRS